MNNMDKKTIEMEDAQKAADICKKFIDDIGQLTGDYGNEKQLVVSPRAAVAFIALLGNVGYAISVVNKGMGMTLLTNMDEILNDEQKD